MQPDATSLSEQDEHAVRAVRTGDAERYRELVERHERRVYAVAWSRLGDAGLAEEVTQEAFIRAYRRLWLLGDGSKFAGWIASIARRVAINFGLRHRRELDKRERWALEQEPASETHPHADEAAAPCTPETLRQTLAELPDVHRECLVLFYLEAKSGVEAAATLGISDAALRVRLHRARAALRERLEEKLEGSLTTLRPTRTLVPAVMAGVLASSSAKAATAGGAGATVLGALAKLAPVKWALSFSLLFFVPFVLFGWLSVQAEIKNFRDANGFRVRMYREDRLRWMIWILLICLAVFSLTATRLLERQPFYLVIAAFSFVTTAMMGRQFVINRSRYFVVLMASSVVLPVGFLLIGLNLAPPSSFLLFVGVQAIMTTLVFGERPARMDYNLFLRAAEAMLDGPEPGRSPTSGTTRFGKQDVLAFGRFLGSRWLADNYRWTRDGLRLRMPSFRFSLWTLGLFSPWSRRSHLLLAWNGKVSARLCGTDQRALTDLRERNIPASGELENRVAVAVETAWERFRRDEVARAERGLGQVPEADVFKVSPTRSGLARWRTRILLVMLATILILTGLDSLRPPWLSGMKPVSVTEAEVRAALAQIAAPSARKNTVSPGVSYFLWNGFVLPPTHLFTTDVLEAMRDQVIREAAVTSDSGGKLKFGGGRPASLAKPMVGGWISWNDLHVAPDQVARSLQDPDFLWPDGWRRILAQRTVQSDGETFTVPQLDGAGVFELRWLRDLNCLDQVDREQLIRNIGSFQVLSGEVRKGLPPIAGWRRVRGLFVTPNWPALQDTYCAVAALEMLHGLDRMDREACRGRVLKLHRGKGFFAPPETDKRWQLQIRGDARDTFCAFETLRILGALDRVKDLEKWQFRVRKASASGETKQPGWEEIEAWVYQQRFERFLHARKDNPQSPARSLLEP